MQANYSSSSVRALHRQSLILGALALILFIVGEPQLAAIGFDSRFVMFAKEMLRHGPGFFPTTYGEPYADYSATSTLFTWLLSLPFGEVTSFTAWLRNHPSIPDPSYWSSLMYGASRSTTST